jgi:hypothetical protein
MSSGANLMTMVGRCGVVIVFVQLSSCRTQPVIVTQRPVQKARASRAQQEVVFFIHTVCARVHADVPTGTCYVHCLGPNFVDINIDVVLVVVCCGGDIQSHP